MNFAHNLSICFDLDGTLVDTAPDLVRVLDKVIAQDGLAGTDFAKARNLVGYGARHLILHAFEEQNRAISEDRADTLLTSFLKEYEADIAALSRPFPGVLDTLKSLKNQGARLSVCTNKPGNLARLLIEALNMSNYFERVVGSGDGVRAKPHADHIFAAAGHRKREDIIMVGDSITDILAARAAKVPVILMGYGYANMPPARLRADKTLRKFRELPAAIENLGLKGTRQSSPLNWSALH